MRCKRELPYSCDLSVSDWLTNITSVGNNCSHELLLPKRQVLLIKQLGKYRRNATTSLRLGQFQCRMQTLRYVGGQGVPGPSPRSAAEFDWLKRLKRWLCSHLVSRHSTRVRCSRRVQGDIWVWTHRLFVSKPDQNSGAVQGRDHVQPQQHDFQLALMSTQLHACVHR